MVHCNFSWIFSFVQVFLLPRRVLHIKRTNLSRYGINYNSKKFESAGSDFSRSSCSSTCAGMTARTRARLGSAWRAKAATTSRTTSSSSNTSRISGGQLKQGILNCTIDLLFDQFGISCMTTDNFCFYLQNRLIQTSQTGGQWYSDTSPFSISWLKQSSVNDMRICGLYFKHCFDYKSMLQIEAYFYDHKS